MAEICGYFRQIRGLVLYLFLGRKPVDKSVCRPFGKRSLSHWRLSAGSELGEHSIEVVVGRPIETCVDVEEIGVGDDRRLALADPAARHQAVVVDRASAARRARRRGGQDRWPAKPTASARARPGRRAAGPNARAARYRRTPAAAAADRPAAVRCAIRAAGRRAAAAGRRPAPIGRASTRSSAGCAQRMGQQQQRACCSDCGIGHADRRDAVALSRARSAPPTRRFEAEALAEHERQAGQQQQRRPLRRGASAAAPVAGERRSRPRRQAAATTAMIDSRAASRRMRRSSSLLLLAVGSRPGATPSSASGSFGFVGCRLAATALAGASSSPERLIAVPSSTSRKRRPGRSVRCVCAAALFPASSGHRVDEAMPASIQCKLRP